MSASVLRISASRLLEIGLSVLPNTVLIISRFRLIFDLQVASQELWKQRMQGCAIGGRCRPSSDESWQPRHLRPLAGLEAERLFSFARDKSRVGTVLLEGVRNVFAENAAEDDVLVLCRVHILAGFAGRELGLASKPR